MSDKKVLSPLDSRLCSTKLKLVIDTFCFEEKDSTRLAECLAARRAILLTVPATARGLGHTVEPDIRITADDLTFEDLLKRVPESIRQELTDRFEVGFGAVLALTRDGYFRVSYYDKR